MGDHEGDDELVLDMDKEGGEATQDVKVEEHLATSHGYDSRKVWLVKVSTCLGALGLSNGVDLVPLQVPKFLQERWAEQTEAGVHLATMRVYNPSVVSFDR
jgi:hypothetical protein